MSPPKTKRVHRNDSAGPNQAAHLAQVLPPPTGLLNLANLPSNVLCQVFSHVPDLVWKTRMRAVSRDWNKLLRSPAVFANTQKVSFIVGNSGLHCQLMNKWTWVTDIHNGVLFPGLALTVDTFLDQVLGKLPLVTSLSIYIRECTLAGLVAQPFLVALRSRNLTNVQLRDLWVDQHRLGTPCIRTTRGAIVELGTLIGRHAATLRSLTGGALEWADQRLLPQIMQCTQLHTLDIRLDCSQSSEHKRGQGLIDSFNATADLFELITARSTDKLIRLNLVVHAEIENIEVVVPQEQFFGPFMRVLQSLPATPKCSVKLQLDSGLLGNYNVLLKLIDAAPSLTDDVSWMAAIEALEISVSPDSNSEILPTIQRLVAGCPRLRSFKLTQFHVHLLFPGLPPFTSGEFADRLFDWWMVELDPRVGSIISFTPVDYVCTFENMQPVRDQIAHRERRMNERHKAKGLELSLGLIEHGGYTGYYLVRNVHLCVPW